jgi:hypothetical protein
VIECGKMSYPDLHKQRRSPALKSLLMTQY